MLTRRPTAMLRALGNCNATLGRSRSCARRTSQRIKEPSHICGKRLNGLGRAMKRESDVRLRLNAYEAPTNDVPPDLEFLRAANTPEMPNAPRPRVVKSLAKRGTNLVIIFRSNHDLHVRPDAFI